MKTENHPLPLGTRVEIVQATNPHNWTGRRGTIFKQLCDTRLPDGTREAVYEVLFEDGPEPEVWWARPGQLAVVRDVRVFGQPHTAAE